jgi:hypothetical protein
MLFGKVVNFENAPTFLNGWHTGGYVLDGQSAERTRTLRE